MAAFAQKTRHLAWSEIPSGVGGIASVMGERKMGKASSAFNGRTGKPIPIFRAFG